MKRTIVQSIIVPKTLASTRAAARRRVPINFKRSAIDETGESYRFRQRDPAGFVPGSFRTIHLGTSGVLAVVGHRRGNPGGAPPPSAHPRAQKAAEHKARAATRAAVRLLDKAEHQLFAAREHFGKAGIQTHGDKASRYAHAVSRLATTLWPMM